MRRPPPWIALVPLTAGAVLLGIGVSEGVRGRPAEEPEVVLVEPAALVLDDFPGWADPRWRDELEALCAAWPPFRADDVAARMRLWDDLESLSFLADVDEPVVDRAGDLRLGFHLRRPAAAILSAEGYLTVDGEGVVLSGRWASPPRCEDLWLPVILPRLAPGPEGAPGAAGGGRARDDFAFDLAAPGDWLAEIAHLAALDTAVSLARHLRPADRAHLGRVAIDGAGWDVRGPEDPGILIGLEDGRWIAFGRAPSADAPGELAAELKWRALSEALACARSDRADAAWEIADVRWDVPELRLGAGARALVAAELARALPEPSAGFPSAWRTDGSGDAGASPRAPDAARALDAGASGGGRRADDRPRVR